MARRQLYDRETNSGPSARAAVIHGVHHELRLLHRVVLVGVGVGAWLRVCRWRRTTEEGADDGYRNMICRHRNYLQSAVCPGLRLRVSLLLCTLYTTGSDPELEPDTANKNKEPEQPASRSTTKSISYQKTTNARSPLSLSLCRIWDLLAPVHPIQGASVRTVPAQRLSEHPTESGLRASTLAAGTRCPRRCPRRHGHRPRRQPLPTRIPCATIRSTFVTSK